MYKYILSDNIDTDNIDNRYYNKSKEEIKTFDQKKLFNLKNQDNPNENNGLPSDVQPGTPPPPPPQKMTALFRRS